MSWWCTALDDAWSWSRWRPYPGVWAAIGLLVIPYFWNMRGRFERRPALLFGGGALLAWLTTDWPIGTLGAGYLASAHMLQYLLYTMVVAPLLILGTPEWMARRLVARLRLYRAVGFLTRRLWVPALAFNLVLIGTHAPATVDGLRQGALGNFVIDLAWLVAGLIMWLPVLIPLPELRRSGLAAIGYLFFATGFVPIVPGSFLTFAEFPLYRTYETAPRVNGFLTAINDQRIAGLTMKLGAVPIAWGVIATLFFRWQRQEETAEVSA